MIYLSSKNNYVISTLTHRRPFIGTITTNQNLPKLLRAHYVFFTTSLKEIPTGFELALIAHNNEINDCPPNTIRLSEDLHCLTNFDVIKFYPDNLKIDVLRKNNKNEKPSLEVMPYRTTRTLLQSNQRNQPEQSQKS